MQHVSWIIPAVSVISSATFAAQGASHLLEAAFFGESRTAVTRAAPQVAAAPRARHSKDGRQLVERNMFCSDCTPPAPDATDPSQVPITTLPLSLLATNVSADPARSFASVVHLESQRQGAYRLGDALPGAGVIKAVRFRHIDFEHGGRVERLLLTGVAEASAPVAAAALPAEPVAAGSVAAADPSSVQAALDAGIRKIDDGNFEVDRALVEQALANPMAFIKGGRAVPSAVDGKPAGFKLYAVRAGSAMAKLGLANGDTLQALNGFDLTSMESTMNAYTKLREATSLELTVTRRGKPTTLRYAIR